MAHRGFSLGELGVVCFGATALWLEFLNLTIARVSFVVVSLTLRLTKIAATDHDTLCSNVPPAHTVAHIPSRSGCGVSRDGISAVTIFGVVSELCQAPCPPIPSPPGEPGEGA